MTENAIMLTLMIENYQVLDDGGPASIIVPQSGLAVGRRVGMGWVLPDASRHISGHHFDVYRQDGRWWLRDISTNGTFLQGSRHRLDKPQPLEHGTRFQVGPYVIVALLDAATTTGRMNPGSLPSYGAPVFRAEHNDDPWALGSGDGLLPVDPSAPLKAPYVPDFAQEFVAFPQYHSSVNPPPPAQNPVEMPDTGQAFLRAFCEGAGLSPDLARGVQPEDLARILGQTMRVASSEIMQALRIRSLAQRFVCAGQQSLPSATGNNPLQFLPDPDQALQALFLQPRTGFLTGAEGVEDALQDLRVHQAALFAALQPALMQLLGDLAPESIDEASEGGRFTGNRKSRAWEIFVQRWDSKVAPHENGILDEFISHFAHAYRDAVAQQQPNNSGKTG